MNTEKKILIIDDDARNIFALSAVLRSRHLACIPAASAMEGLAILEERSDIGIVLMDMMMPDMDGYTAIPRIRNIEKIAAIPVVAVTAQAMSGDKERCLQAGADRYISKPVNVDRLFELLNEYLK
jgi:two-component system cell cycle response regulator DivK